MLLEHRAKRPDSACVAPSAVPCGAVTLGERARVLHGGVLTAEDGEVRVGAETVVLENALVRGRAGHPAPLGTRSLSGPHAHVTAEDEVFVATGASLFPGAVPRRRGRGTLRTADQRRPARPSGLRPDSVVPLGWIAADDPAAPFSPDPDDDLRETQRGLDFPGTVHGVPRGTPMRELMPRQADFHGAHGDDRLLDG